MTNLTTLSNVPATALSATASTVTDSDPAPVHAHPYRRHGLALTVGSLAWAAGILLLGLNPESGLPALSYGLSSLLFQIGVAHLLVVMARTRAVGTGRFARFYLVLVGVLVGLAMLSTISDSVGIADMTNPLFAVMDACWPLSMLGMFTLAIRIAVAGRWSGLARWWPLLAESWAVVTIPSMMILGTTGAQWVGGLHLVVGYAVLGLIVARKPA